ncbi:MAG: recombination mediator RecR [Phycisphaerales bacterium]|nr:recombination mediator RecR [Phycisphaerales bacterium]
MGKNGTHEGARGGGGNGGGGSGGKGFGNVGSGYPLAVRELIERLSGLPGIGIRSAERLAFHILKAESGDALALASAIRAVKESVRHCKVCFNLSDGDVCGVCSNPKRDRSMVCVVEQPKDLIALEQTGMYRGLFHVLMGRLSPLDGVGPEDLTIAHLVGRVRRSQEADDGDGRVRIEEIVLGLNPTLEGDGTALYLAQELSGFGVKVTRLARGVPTGSSLEFANKAVLGDAIEGRQVM